jgi:hypothetical protein
MFRRKAGRNRSWLGSYKKIRNENCMKWYDTMKQQGASEREPHDSEVI